MDKKTVLALVAILVIATLGLFLPVGQEAVERIVGAVSTLDGVDSPFITVNGQREWRGTVPMMATSSALCSFENPFNGTSSIEYLSAEVLNRGGLSQANSFVISTGTTAFATSSTNLVHNYAMGTAPFSVQFQKNSATTTGSTAGAPTAVLPGMTTTGTSAYFLAPNERVNFVIATTTVGGGGTFATYMTGTCSAVFKKV